LKRVSVIIPNWNGRDLLGPCLESLYRQQFDDFETVLVDNGSTDGSISFVEQNFPQVAIVRFSENRGFSAAVNAGISASASPYVCLLNNDTEVDPRWLGTLVQALAADVQAGSAASKVLYFSDPHSVNSAGDEFSLFGVAYQRRLMPGDTDLFNQGRYVFSACGAAALYRRELFDKVGLFDEAFFAYQEDVDLGFRAQLLGYRCLFVPKAIVYHKYQMTSSRVSGLRIYLNERNKYFVLIKNLPTKLVFFCFPLIALHEALCFIKALSRGYLGIYFKALKDVWNHLPHMLQHRRCIQTHRVADDGYIRSLLRFREPFRFFFYRLGVLRSVKRQEVTDSSNESIFQDRASQ
jgi:GT2 family glycosyltransferase